MALIFLGCTDPNVNADDSERVNLISKRSWQLEKYTNTSGANISDGQLNSSARLLYGLAFTFNKNKSVQGVAKTNKEIINRGTWAIESDNETLNIDIDGFSGEFEIVSLNNTSMVLKSKTDNPDIGVDAEVHLVFSEYRM